MRIAKHILYYLSVPAAIVLWLGGYVLLDALIFPLENLEYLSPRFFSYTAIFTPFCRASSLF